MLKAILFDFSKTIIHNRQWLDLEIYDLPRLAFARLAEEGHIQALTDAQLEQAEALNKAIRRKANETRRETSHVEDLSLIVETLGLKAQISQDLIKETVAALHKSCLPAVNLLPGIAEALPALQAAGYRLGVISNAANSDFLHWTFEAHDLASYFEFVIVSEAFHTRKPDLKLFEIALDQMGLTPEQAVYVGDDLVKDIDAAKRMGMRAIWFSSKSGDQQHPDLSPPDAVITDHQDILKHVSGWA